MSDRPKLSLIPSDLLLDQRVTYLYDQIKKIKAGTITVTASSGSGGSSDTDLFLRWAGHVKPSYYVASQTPTLRDAEHTNTSGTLTSPVTIPMTPLTNALAGDVLFVTLQYLHYGTDATHPAAEPVITLTDTIGNTWVNVAHWFQASGAFSSPQGISLWACLSAKAGANTITATLTIGGGFGTSAQVDMVYADITGFTATAVDLSNVAYSAASSSLPSQTLITSTPNELVFAAFGCQANTNGITAQAGFAVANAPIASLNTTSEFGLAAAAGIQALSVTSSAACTNWIMAAVGIKGNVATVVKGAQLSFSVNDVIRFQGETFVCVTDNPGGVLPHASADWSTYWEIIGNGNPDNIVNAQTGATYTLLDSDDRKLVSSGNASGCAVTVPTAGGPQAASFPDGWWCDIQNTGTGNVTLTPSGTNRIDGSTAALVIAGGCGCRLYSWAGNWYTQRGVTVAPLQVNGSAVTGTLAVANLSDSTPAAPSGAINVKFQKDGSNPTNVSAYVRGIPNLVDVPPAVAGSLDDEFTDAVWNTNGKWSWVNQGVATAAQASSWLGLTKGATVGDSNAVIVQVAPATPYEVTAKITTLMSSGNFRAAGMCFYDTGTTKLIRFGIEQTNGIVVAYYTNPTTFSSSPASQTLALGAGGPIYLKMKDDGGNLIFSYSYDGVNFLQFLSVSRTAFIAAGPNRVGLCINNNQNAGMNLTTTLGADYFRRTL